ncbi:sugar phosphate isomerase/epimerase family protein [Maribacter sp. HTCC2170]|uniref:sugar phosphate isomerase/epimerase family protein n=1 Tax=Maribacter sp. (strain HTCC2170 / KCCM 42371) TaxID=313603 RepID=UPI00006B4775|nr:sugar phosphate isomerase/epimerase [Maribacter sp. HTCC2170]EAR01798.1 Sugar phosphate isomerase/epimerase [Maribacter sp. HTCC2170]
MKNKIIVILALIVSQIGIQQLAAQEFGIQLYSLRNQFKKDVSGSLKTISEWGLTNLEGGDTYGLSFEEFDGLLNEFELDVVSVGASYDDLKNKSEEVLANAKRFSANFVMCPWIPHKGNEFNIENVKEAVKVFNNAGKLFKEAGITLAYHAHGYEFRPYKNDTLFDYMVENAQFFAFEMDVFWVQHGGVDPMALLNKYPEKFVLFHLKDMAKSVVGNNTGHEDVETNVVLGTGQVDIEGVVKRAREIGIAKYMFIEDECSRVMQQVPESLEFIKGIE